MVTCNICGTNKSLEELQPQFRYICKDCWKRVQVYIIDLFGKEQQIDKDLFY